MRSSLRIAASLLLCLPPFVFADVRPNTSAGQNQSTTSPTTTSSPTKPSTGTTSQIQIVYQPSDIYTTGTEEDVKTTFAIRALAAGLKGPKIVAGSLRDEDSSEQLPTEAFGLVGQDGKPPEGDISTTDLTRLSICLNKDWRRAGKYSGTLWIGAVGDSGAQSIALKVFIRPESSWFVGFLAIAAGAGLSWFAMFWVTRQRQLAANQVLIARLQTVVANLTQTLQEMPQSGAPLATRSIQHLDQVSKDRLPELMHDKELSAIAGVTVPPSESVSVVDEIDGMNRIVQHGFDELFRLWNTPGANQAALGPLFQEMDALGAIVQPLNTLDAKIQAILAKSPTPTARVLVNGQLPTLPSEDSVVQRVVTTTYLLDLLSVATVVVAGLFVLIWRNPGFGTIGNYLEAFLWGLGLKIGSDLTKLGPNDIRTSFGIKTPAP